MTSIRRASNPPQKLTRLSVLPLVTTMLALFLISVSYAGIFDIITTHTQYKQVDKDTWEITYRFGAKDCELDLMNELKKDTTIRFYDTPIRWIEKTIKVKAYDYQQAKEQAYKNYGLVEEFVMERIEYAYNNLRKRAN